MFSLDQVVPWGRSYQEYRLMFALSEEHLRLRILGCADGPASFNAQATRAGCAVVSVDPLYRLDSKAILQRITKTYNRILEQMRANQHQFVWNVFGSVDELGRARMQAMLAFLADHEQGKRQGRYINAELPVLPFADKSFDLALCSHFLFLYTEQLGEEFHHRAILELCRVAKEVRIFPLIALDGSPSRHLPGIMESLRSQCEVRLDTVPYEFQRGGNQMMQVRPATKV